MKLYIFFILLISFSACSNDSKKSDTIASTMIKNDSLFFVFEDNSNIKVAELGNVVLASLDTGKQKCYFIQKHPINNSDSVYIGFKLDVKSKILDTLFITPGIKIFEVFEDSNTLHIVIENMEDLESETRIFINKYTGKMKNFEDGTFLYFSAKDKTIAFYVYLPKALEQDCRYPYIQYELNTNLEIVGQHNMSICD